MSHPPDSPRIPWIILAPRSSAWSPAEFLSTARGAIMEPFSAARMDVLETISRALLGHRSLRRDPGAVALGFWLRRSHLVALETAFRETGAKGLRVPAGLVFHVTPANVDTMFVYSWALSFLAGNANIVRLTTSVSPLMEELLRCLDEALASRAEVAKGNVFVTYEHDDALTAHLSADCDTRIVWGGDETVRRLRAVPLNPHATERSFASKRSLSLIAADAYLRVSIEERNRVAEKMATDLVPFGQMACSSPHVLFWLGEAESARAAQLDFEQRLEPAMASKAGEPELGWAVRRVNFAFGQAAQGNVSNLRHEAHSTQVSYVGANAAENSYPCGGGFVGHATVKSFAEFTEILQRDHQTITYFGLSDSERLSLALGAGRAGVDRIVPIGQALDFTPVWDGYELWSDLTRRIIVA